MLPPATIVVLSLTSVAAVAAPRSLRVTHAHLVPVCLGATPVEACTRSWETSDAPMTLTFTMRNAPRRGIPDAPSGHATITFTPEPGHRYEVEVRADAGTFARRVWPEGAWTPVVRDRTADRVVSSAPSWSPAPCASASGER